MTTANPLIFISENYQNSINKVSQCNVNLLHNNLLTKINSLPYFKFINQLEIQKTLNFDNIGTGKLISKKMRTKLLSWMENLSIQTFNFSIKTLILSIKILDQYLSITNESPSILQLIGCACLYVAAKVHEPTIVAASCYVIASANCFSQEQLFQKQKEIFKALKYNTSFVCPLRVYKTIIQNSDFEILDKFKLQDIQNIFLKITKNLQFSNFKTLQIIVAILITSQAKKSSLDQVQLLQNLKRFSHY